ncbi:chaplin family protein [Streptomyces viridiviolaceus]
MRQTLSRGVFAAAAATGILSLSGTPALADSIAVGATEDSSGLLSGNNIQAPIEVPVNVCGNTIGAVAALNPATGNSCGNTSHGDQPSVASSGTASTSSSSTGSSAAGGSRAVGTTEDASGLVSGNNIQAPVSVPVNVCGNTVDVLAALNPATGNSCGNTSYGDQPSAASSGTSSTAGSEAVATSEEAYGLLSGNNVQAPLGVPVNVCGNTIDVVAVLNDAYGNSCGNTYGPEYGTDEVTPPASCDDCETPPSTTTPAPPTRVVETPPSVGVEEPGMVPQLAETGSEGMLVASVAGAALLTGGAMLYRRGRTAARQ